jgi:hypothetical protein
MYHGSCTVSGITVLHYHCVCWVYVAVFWKYIFNCVSQMKRYLIVLKNVECGLVMIM